MAVWASDLGGLVMRLWAWCQVEPLLMSSVLSLLCTYSARCSQGQFELRFYIKVNQTISCNKLSCIILITLSTTDISLLYVAASSLALTSVPDGGGSRSQQHGANSVLHCVLRELQRESSPTGNASLLRLGFRLVATLSLSSECRGVLWKVRFVNPSFKKSCLM
jgi:hypothetical protein